MGSIRNIDTIIAFKKNLNYHETHHAPSDSPIPSLY